MTAQIKIKVQRKAIVKLKVLPRFSATLIAGDGAGVSRAANGDYTISLAPLASIPTHSYLGNITGTPASPISVSNTQLTADLDIHGTTLNNSIDGANDELIYYDASANAIRRATLTSVAGSNIAGVSSVGGAAGALSLGTGLSIATSTINTKWTTATNDIYTNNSGNVGIGTATHFSTRFAQQFEAAASANAGGAVLSVWSAADPDHSAILDFNRSHHSTIGTHAAVAFNYALGALVFRGSDGASFINSANILGQVDGTVASNQVPGRLVFSTASSTGTITERVRIDKAGNAGIGTILPLSRVHASGPQTNTDAASTGQVIIEDTAAYSAPPIAGLQFSVKYNSGGSFAHGVAIQAYKENAVDGDFAQGWRVVTQANGDSPSIKMAVTGAGEALIPNRAGVYGVMPGMAGVTGLGSADDKVAIQTIVDAATVVEIFPGTYYINQDATWGGGKTYIIHRGAYLKVESGKTLTIRGTVQAGPYKWLGTSAVAYDLAGTVLGMGKVMPEWWFCNRDGSTGDSDAFNKAIACAQASNGSDCDDLVFEMQRGSYALDKTVTFTCSQTYNWHIRGTGSSGSGSGATRLIALSTITATTAAVTAGGVAGTVAFYITGNAAGDVTTDLQVCDFDIINQTQGAGASHGLVIGAPSAYLLAGRHYNRVENVCVSGFAIDIQQQNTRLVRWDRTSIEIADSANAKAASTTGVVLTAVGGSAFTSKIDNGSGGAGMILNVSASALGAIYLGAVVSGAGVTANTIVTAFGSGTGGIGTYTVSISQNVASESMTTKGGTCGDTTITSSQFTGRVAADGAINGKSFSVNDLGGARVHLTGIRFSDDCIFYGSSTQLELAATGISSTIDDVWINAGVQFESPATGSTMMSWLLDNGSTLSDVHVDGVYGIGSGFTKNIVASIGSGGGTLQGVFITNSFLSSTIHEYIDIRGTNGTARGVTIIGNILRDPDVAGAANAAIYIENVNQATANSNTMSGTSGANRANMVLFNTGGIYQTARSNNSGGMVSGTIVPTAGRTGENIGNNV